MISTTKLSVLSWLIFVALMIVWGSSFILIKKGLDVFTATQVGAMRIGIAFLVLLPSAILIGWQEPVALIPITIMTLILGSLLGIFIDKYTGHL